jgi:general secretion pathway protein D
LCLATVLAGGFVPAAVPAVAIAAERSGAPQAYTFAFKDADVSQVAEAILGSTLGVAYTVDPAVTTKMSFRIEQRLTRAQLLEAFEAALAANEIALVREGETIRLVPRAKAKSAATIRTAGEGVHHAGYEVVAVPLAYASPSEVAKALESIAPANTVIYTNDKQGLLILGGSGEELQSALQTVKVFDRSSFEGTKIRWFELGKASSATVAADLEKVLSAAGVTGVGVVPLKRLNGIFLFARTSAALDAAAEWVAKLDQPSAEKSTSLYFYHPKNAAAEALSKTLNTLLNGQSGADPSSVGGQARGGGAMASASGQGQVQAVSAPPAAPIAQIGAVASSGAAQSLFGSGEEAVRVGVDKESNTLLVSAAPGAWIQIQKILQEIDRAPNQILIEASILEVTLTKGDSFGVDWSAAGLNGQLTGQNINSGSGTVGASVPGFAVTYLTKNIQASITALGSKSNIQVVSSPKIMALDNHTAKLDVGDQVPIVTQTAQSTSGSGSPLVSSVDYRSTGVILNVTPRITGDDKIVLDVDQEVSDASQTTTSGISSPTISERKFESSLVLRDGGVVALGGLISSNRTVTDSGMPYLMNIPWVGSIFKTSSKTTTRTELIVLLSAKIIRDEASTKKVMADLLADMHEIETSGLIKTPRK